MLYYNNFHRWHADKVWEMYNATITDTYMNKNVHVANLTLRYIKKNKCWKTNSRSLVYNIDVDECKEQLNKLRNIILCDDLQYVYKMCSYITQHNILHADIMIHVLNCYTRFLDFS